MQKYFFSFINKFKIILFIISIIIIFKINFGIFNPIFIISSESMKPNYNIGDIVEVHDAYGYYYSVRVKEFIISHDNTGIKCYPTFESVEASNNVVIWTNSIA